MADMKAHITYDDDAIDPSRAIAYIHPANEASIKLVLAADPKTEDGRSPFMWIRLANGDLILGVFPQGDTYFEVEGDSDFWGVYADPAAPDGPH